MRSYGEKPLRQQDMVFSVEKTRQELEAAIDYENKRTNVDSAKKRAVQYGYDYEGFRQMVLGANLFSIKSPELLTFSEGKPAVQRQPTIFNAEHTTFNNVKDLSMMDVEETKQFNMLIAEQLNNTELKAKNFREFRKNFDKFYKTELNEISAQTTYMLFKAQDLQSLKKIFQMDFDISYFLKIVHVLDYTFEKAIIPTKNQEEMEFISGFLNEMSKLKDFQFSIPGFLSGSEKTKLKDFMKKYDEGVRKHFENIPESHDEMLKYYLK